MWNAGRGERGVVRRTGSVTRKLAKGTSPKFESIYDQEALRVAVWSRPEEKWKIARETKITQLGCRKARYN